MSSSSQLVLFGAGAAGEYTLAHLRAQGVSPCCFADNDPSKWDTHVEGVPIYSPERAVEAFPDAAWVVTAIRRPAAVELRAQIRAMGVRTKPLWECLPVCHGLPSDTTITTFDYIVCDDKETMLELYDQVRFRRTPDYDRQRPPSDIADIYFPGFIRHRDEEHYVDCGAADGDTVREFRKRWSSYAQISAFEPDPENYRKLSVSILDDERNHALRAALGDRNGIAEFVASGDYSSHLRASEENHTGSAVPIIKLDDNFDWTLPPTYIKFDIEGSELEALWGARRLLREYSPVLAVCAYHTSDHLWQIPLLVHAIQPDYRCLLRRYAEGAFELVWYFVPPERIVNV